MLRLPRFKYLAPESLADAAAMIAHEDRAMLLAGGTDVFPKMKRRQMMPATLVSLAKIDTLAGVSNGDGVRIGAMTPLARLEQHPALAYGARALAMAAHLVSTPQLREMGTLGGNLCLDTRCNWYDQSAFWRDAEGHCMKTHADVVCRVATSSPRCLAVASADTVPALLALGARVHITNAHGDRDVDLADIYREDGIRYLTLERGDIVSAVVLPPLNAWRSTYWKLRDRNSFDFPIAGVAAAVRMDGDVVADARLAITAFSSRPMLVPTAATALIGRRIDDESIAAAADACHKAARPMDNTSGTIAQRKIAARVFTERALRELASL